MLASAPIASCLPASATGGETEPVLTWYAHGVQAALLDSAEGVPAASLALPRAVEALAAITLDDPKAREAVTNALVARLGDSASGVRGAAAWVLGQITPDDPKARAAVTNALFASLDSDVRWAATQALGQITKDDPKARAAATNALVAHLGDSDSDVRQAAATALSQIGPITAPTVLTALRMRSSSAASDGGRWRASAIAFSGASGKPSDAWAYLTFLGGLEPGSMRD